MPGFIPPKMPAVARRPAVIGERGDDPRDRGSPRWLGRLGRGIDLTLGGFIATLFGSAAAYGCHSWRAIPQWVFWLLLGIAALGYAAFGSGVWCLTWPDPEPPVDRKYTRSAMVVRGFLCVSCVALVVISGRLILVEGTGTDRSKLLAMTVFGFIELISFAAGLVYLRELGRRLGETALRETVRKMMIGYGVSCGVFLSETAIAEWCGKRAIKMDDAVVQLFAMLRFCGGVAALVLTVFYVVMLERFGRRLHQRRIGKLRAGV